MRVVQVHPREPAFGSGLCKPGRGFSNRCVPALLDGVQESGVVFSDLELIRVVGEAAAEPRLFRQHDRRHEASGLESALLQDFSEDRDVLSKRRRDVIANAVLGGIETRKKRDVRWPRQRHLRRCMEGHRTLTGQAIEVRCCDRRISIGAEPIGSERIDGNQQEMARRTRRRRRRLLNARRADCA